MSVFQGSAHPPSPPPPHPKTDLNHHPPPLLTTPPPLHPQGNFEDPTILFVNDPELVELKLVEGEPMVVVQFAAQQIKCVRDQFGNVVDGDPNSIQVWGQVLDRVEGFKASGFQGRGYGHRPRQHPSVRLG